MLDDDYRDYLRRADACTTVRELRALAESALRLYPGDPLAVLVADTCSMYAAGVLERIGAVRAHRAAMTDLANAAELVTHSRR